MRLFKRSRSARVFKAGSNSTSTFGSASFMRAFWALRFRLEEARPGVTLLLGPVGSGKTVVAGAIEKLLRDMPVVTVASVSADQGREEFVRAVLNEVLPKSVLRDLDDQALDDVFAHLRSIGQKVVVLIDDADRLSDSMLINVMRFVGGTAAESGAVQVVLVGRPTLEARLQQPAFSEAALLVTATVWLEAIESHEMAGYVANYFAARSAANGRRHEANPFTKEAIAALHRHSHGNPSTINRLCQCALIGNPRSINAGQIDMAAFLCGLAGPPDSYSGRSNVSDRGLLPVKSLPTPAPRAELGLAIRVAPVVALASLILAIGYQMNLGDRLLRSFAHSDADEASTVSIPAPVLLADAARSPYAGWTTSESEKNRLERDGKDDAVATAPTRRAQTTTATDDKSSDASPSDEVAPPSSSTEIDPDQSINPEPIGQAAAGESENSASPLEETIEPGAGEGRHDAEAAPELETDLRSIPSEAALPKSENAANAAPPAVETPPIESPQAVIPPSDANQALAKPQPASPPNAVAPAASAPAARLQPNIDVEPLMARGRALLNGGDLAGARLFFERAAAQGHSVAMTEIGRTFDPTELRRLGAVGVRGDRDRALTWYRRAANAGDRHALDLIAASLADKESRSGSCEGCGPGRSPRR